MKLKTCIHVPATNATLCKNMILAQLFINYAKYTKTNISNGSCVIIQTLAHTSNLFLLLLLVYFLVFFCHPLVLDVHPNISGYSLFLLVPYGHAGIVHLCLKKNKMPKCSRQDFKTVKTTIHIMVVMAIFHL